MLVVYVENLFYLVVVNVLLEVAELQLDELVSPEYPEALAPGPEQTPRRTSDGYFYVLGGFLVLGRNEIINLLFEVHLSCYVFLPLHSVEDLLTGVEVDVDRNVVVCEEFAVGEVLVLV